MDTKKGWNSRMKEAASKEEALKLLKQAQDQLPNAAYRKVLRTYVRLWA